MDEPPAELVDVTKSIFKILPSFKQIYKEAGIPLIEIQQRVGYDLTIIRDAIREMMANHQIQGYLDHRQTVNDPSDDILFLKEEPEFQCEMCKTRKSMTDPYYQCTQCKRLLCTSCYSDMNQVGHIKCAFCDSIEFSSSS